MQVTDRPFASHVRNSRNDAKPRHSGFKGALDVSGVLSLFSPFSFFLPLPFWALSLANFILRFLFFPAMAKEGAIGYSILHTLKYSLVTQMVRNLSAMQETWVQSLGQEDPLQKGMTTHSSILAWKIPRTQEPGGLQSTRSQSQTQLID